MVLNIWEKGKDYCLEIDCVGLFQYDVYDKETQKETSHSVFIWVNKNEEGALNTIDTCDLLTTDIKEIVATHEKSLLPESNQAIGEILEKDFAGIYDTKIS